MANSMHIHCSSCLKVFDGNPKYLSIMGFKIYICPHCKNKFIYPMISAQRILYLGIILLFLSVLIITLANNLFIFTENIVILPYILFPFAVFSIFALIKDYLLKSDTYMTIIAEETPIDNGIHTSDENLCTERNNSPRIFSRNRNLPPPRNRLYMKPYFIPLTMIVALLLCTKYYKIIPKQLRADMINLMSATSDIMKNTYSEIFFDIADKPNNSKGLLRPIAKGTKRTDTHQKDKEEAAIIKHFLQDTMAEVDTFDNKCASEFNNIGLYNLLDAKHIENDKNFSESRVILSRANAVLLKFESGHKQLMRNFRGKIKTLNISSPMKEAMLKGYDDSVAKSMITFNDNIELQRKVLREFEEIINLLESRKGYWVVKSNGILFFTENDAACYNAHIESILRILKTLSEIEQRTVKKTEDEIDSLMKELCK